MATPLTPTLLDLETQINQPEPGQFIGFDSGIIQNAAIPQDSLTAAFGMSPNQWDVEERQYESELASWRETAMGDVEKAALDPDNYFKSDELDFGANVQESRKLATNDLFLQVNSDGDQVPVRGPEREFLRGYVAEQMFDGRGAESEELFNGEIAKWAQGRKDTRELSSEMQVAASGYELTNAAESEGRQMPDFDSWVAQSKGKPGFDRNKLADYREQWNVKREAIREVAEPFMPELKAVWQAFQKGEDAGSAAASAYYATTPEERPQFMDALAIMGKALPQEEQETFWKNLKKSTGRGVSGMGNSIVRSLVQNFQDEVEGSVAFTPEQYEAKRGIKGAIKEVSKGMDFVDEVIRVQQQSYDPIKKLNDGWLGAVEGGIYAAPAAISTTVLAMTPVAGQYLTYQMMKGSAYSSVRGDLISRGMNPDKAAEFADEWATPIAALQYIPERIGFETITRNLPVFNKTLTRLSDGIRNRALRGLTATAATGAVELSTEMVQDLVPGFVQEVAGALQEDVPDVVWMNGKDGVFDDYGFKTIETAVAILPLAIFGAAIGLNREARAKAFAEAAPAQRSAFGITTEANAKIDAAAAQGQASLNAAIDEAMATRNPNSETAKAAVVALEAEQKAQEENAKLAIDSGVFPVIRQNAEGWTVIDRDTGAEYGPLPTPEDAMRLARANFSAVQDANAEQIGYMASMLEGVALTTKNDKGKTDTSLDLGQAMTATIMAASSPEAAAQVRQQLEVMEKAGEIDEDFAGLVFGSSQTDFEQGQRRTLNKLFQGSSIATVFHEAWHGYSAEALATGRMTRDEQLDFAIGMNDLFAAANNRRAQKVLLFPEGTTRENITDTMLDEAISKIAEAEVLKSRQGGKGREGDGRKNVQGITSGMVTRNMKALVARKMKAAKKFSAMFEAVRGYFGVAMSRAIIMRKAERDGKLDPKKYEAFVSKLTGLSEQDSFDANAAKVTRDIIGGPSFSLGGTLGVGFDQAQSEGRTFIGNDGKERFEMDASQATLNTQPLENLTKTDRSAFRAEGLTYAKGPAGWQLLIVPPNVEKTEDIITVAGLSDKEAARMVSPAIFSKMQANEGTESVIGGGWLPALEIKEAFVFQPRATQPLDAILNFPELFTAYPDLGTINVAVEASLRSSARIEFSQTGEAYRIVLGKYNQLSSLLHEIQHWIQNKEGFSQGGSPANFRGVLGESQAFKAYLGLPGETEARGVQRRISMTAEERKQNHFMDDWGSYSIGEDIIDPLISNAAKKVKPPKAREKIFGDIITRLQKLNRLVESRGVAFNFDAFGKPFEGEFSDEKTGILNALAVLDGILAAVPPDLRGRIGGYTQLAKLDTDAKRLDYLKRRLKTVDRVVNDWLKKEYGAMFDKLLDRAKPVKGKPGEKPKGKIGADVHALFDVLRQAKTWTAENAEAHAAGLESQIGTGDLTPEQEAHATLEANLVRLVADWKDADAARRASAVQNATSVFESGYAKFKLAKLMEAEDRGIRRKSLETDTGKTGDAGERDEKILADNGLKGGWKDNFLSLISFEQLSEYIFGRDSKEATRIVDMERAAAAMKEDAVQTDMDSLENLFESITGSALEGEKLRWTLSQKSIKVGNRQLSPLEAITATLMWRQEDGRRHMLGHKDENGNFSGKWHYDQAFIDKIEAALSPEAQAVRAHIASEYSKEWEQINPTFVQLNGISLPKNPNYSPLTVKPQTASAGQMVDPVTGSTMSGASTTPGSLRSRGQAIAEPEFRDALQTFIAHRKQIQHWLAYAPFNAEAGTILRNRDLGNAIEARGGDQALTLMRGWVDFFVQGGTRDAQAQIDLNKMMNRISGRAAASVLIGRMGVIAIQTTQLGAALAEMPVGSFAMRFGKLMTGQLEWGAAFRSEYIQRRLAQMPVVVQQAMEGLKASKPNWLKYHVQKLGLLISGTDARMTAGTFAIVHDYQLKQARSMGLSGAEADAYAMNAAERVVDRIAQPTRAGTRSYFENTSAGGPAMRVLWSFASESRQKLMLSLWRLGSADRSLGEKARAVAVTWVVGGMVATIIRAAMRDVRDDDDDEWFDEKNWGVKRLALSSLTGPFQGIPFIGDMIEGGVYSMAGEYLPEGNLFSSIPKSLKTATQVSEWGDKKPDEIIRDIETILSGAALVDPTGNSAATASLSHLVRDLFSIGQNIAQ